MSVFKEAFGGRRVHGVPCEGRSQAATAGVGPTDPAGRARAAGTTLQALASGAVRGDILLSQDALSAVVGYGSHGTWAQLWSLYGTRLGEELLSQGPPQAA